MNKKIVLSVLLITSSISARIQEIYPDLLIAAAKGDVKEVQALIDQGVDIDTKSSSGRTALILATELGKDKVVRFLLDNGANPNIAIIGDPSACTEQETPDVPVACADILPGAKLPFLIHEGWTALHFAPSAGFVDLLLKAGANVDSKDKRGRTPLMLRAQVGDLKSVDLLLRRGASANERSNKGRSALYYIVAYSDNADGVHESRWFIIMSKLIDHGAEVDDEILEVAEKRRNKEKLTKVLKRRPRNGINSIVKNG